jgi:rhodanese-related sulfurtransferase
MRHLAKILLILISGCFLAGNAFAELHNLNNKQLQQMMQDKVVLVDIRRAEEWQQTGVIKGSHLLTFFDKKGNYNLHKWLADLSQIVGKNDKIILICRTGNRTGMVGKFMDQKLGFPQVYQLKNGISRWDGPKRQVITEK